MRTSSRRMQAVLALAVAALLTEATGDAWGAATTGFSQTASGGTTGYDYNTGANWAGGTINGIWDASLALTANQTVTFAADTPLTTGLTFNYTGNYSETLRADGAANHLLTLAGDIAVNPASNQTVTIGSAAANQNLNVNLGGATRTFSVNSSKTLSFVNAISGTKPTDGVTVAGAGQVVLSASNTYSGSTTLNGGTLSLTGATASIANSALTANPGTTVNFNSNTNGVTGANRAASLTLNGSNLNVNGNSTANSVDSISGPLTASLQNDTLNLNPNAAKNAQLQIGSFARNPGGVIFFNGANLGVNTIASATAGSSNVVFNTAPTLAGAPSGSGTTINILAGAFGGTPANGLSTGLLTYDPANGIRALNTATEYTSTITDGQTQLDNVRLVGATGTAATFTVNSTTQINSLSMSVSGTSGKAGVTINGTGTLKINSGVIFGSQTISSEPASTDAMEITVPTLDFNGQEAVINTNTTFNWNQGSLTQAPLDIQSAITNVSGVTMSGGGELQLSGTTPNTYTGVTTINSGVLNLAKSGVAYNHAIGGDLVVNGGIVIWFNGEQVPDTSNITLNGGTIVMAHSTNTGSSSGETFHNFIMTGGNYYGGSGWNGGGYTTILGTATFTGGTFEAKTAHVVTVSGLMSISNNAVFNIDGSSSNGTTTLAANGGLTITNTPTGIYTPITIGNSSKLALAGGLTFIGNATNTNTITLAAATGGSIALSGSNTFAIGHGAAAVDLTISAPITDSSTAAGSLTKTGIGTLALLGNNSYSGTTTISTGTVLVGNGGTSGTLGTGPIVNNATLVFNRSDSFSITSLISGAGSFTQAGTGTIMLNNANTYTGPTIVKAGTLKLGPVYTSSLTNQTFTSDATAGIGTTSPYGSSGYTEALAFNQGANLTINGQLFTNTGTTTSGTGLSGTNWSVSGIPNNGASGSFPSGFTLGSSNVTYSLLNHFYYGAGNGSVETITITGLTAGQSYDARLYYRSWGAPTDNRSAALTFNGGTVPQTLNPVNQDGDANAHYLDYTYIVGSTGTLTITINPPTGNSWHVYGFTNQAIGNSAAATANNCLPMTTPLTIQSGATFDLNGGNQQIASLGDVTGSGGGNVINNGSATSILTLSPSSGSTTFSGTIQDGTAKLALTKSGPGTQILTGANTYTGGTTVSAGELDVANIPANSPVSVTGGKLLLAKDTAQNHTLVTLSSLTGSTGGTLDLTNHDLLIPHGLQNTSMSSYLGLVTTQTTVDGAPNAPTAIALVSGKDYKALGGPSTLADTDLYGRFTFKGDANLDGKITADDYLALDVGYLFGLTGWTHGDFEQTTGTITAQDYADIDLSYQYQNGKTAAAGEIALHTQWFGAAYTNAFAALNAPAVPEPASLALLGLGALSLLKRRR